MAKQVRYFRQIVSHLNERYGSEKTDRIMDKALKRYDEILEENKNEPKEYHMHTIPLKGSIRRSRCLMR